MNKGKGNSIIGEAKKEAEQIKKDKFSGEGKVFRA